MRRVGPVFLILILEASAALAQEKPVSIRGRVVAAENGVPLRRARVALVPRGSRIQAWLTDEEGRFALTVPDAPTALLVTKAGYASDIVAVSHDTAAAPPELEIRLSKGAVISGRVMEGAGAPAVGARVLARVQGAAGDARRAVTFESETDDLGEYRISGLPAGRYDVFAAASAGRLMGAPERALVQDLITQGLPLAPAMAQGPTRAIDVRQGEESVDVNFQMESPAPIDSMNLQIQFPRQIDPSVMAEVLAQAKVLADRLPQEGPGRRAAIRGRVTTQAGAPVVGAQVRGTSTGSIRMVLTDGTGRFDLDRLTIGVYTLEVSKSGYVHLRDGPQLDVPGSQTVRVGTDQTVDGIDVVLSRGGALTGTIVDEFGDPLQGVRVQAMQLRREGGRTVAIRVGWDRPTDDRGRYRVFGVLPGSYLVVASVDASASGTDRARSQGFARRYYPGTPDVAGAQLISVEAEREVAGMDLTFAPSVTVSVSGVAFDESGKPLVGSATLAPSQRSGAIATNPRQVPVAPDGSFELPDVPPGDYVVQAIGERQPGLEAEFGAEYLSVSDRPPSPLTIHASSGSTVHGRIVVEGFQEPPTTGISIRALTTDFDRGPAAGRGPQGFALYDDGRFYLTGLHGAMQFGLAAAPAGWYLKSLTIAGVDATDTVFDFGRTAQIHLDVELVLSTAGASITGRVMDDSVARPNHSVIVFADSRDKWFPGSRHVKYARTFNDGSFDVPGLPPGDYLVAAVDARDGLEAGDWQSPDVLGRVSSRATRVTLGPGQSFATTLRVSRR